MRPVYKHMVGHLINTDHSADGGVRGDQVPHYCESHGQSSYYMFRKTEAELKALIG